MRNIFPKTPHKLGTFRGSALAGALSKPIGGERLEVRREGRPESCHKIGAGEAAGLGRPATPQAGCVTKTRPVAPRFVQIRTLSADLVARCPATPRSTSKRHGRELTPKGSQHIGLPLDMPKLPPRCSSSSCCVEPSLALHIQETPHPMMWRAPRDVARPSPRAAQMANAPQPAMALPLRHIACVFDASSRKRVGGAVNSKQCVFASLHHPW